MRDADVAEAFIKDAALQSWSSPLEACVAVDLLKNSGLQVRAGFSNDNNTAAREGRDCLILTPARKGVTTPVGVRFAPALECFQAPSTCLNRTFADWIVLSKEPHCCPSHQHWCSLILFGRHALWWRVARCSPTPGDSCSCRNCSLTYPCPNLFCSFCHFFLGVTTGRGQLWLPPGRNEGCRGLQVAFSSACDLILRYCTGHHARRMEVIFHRESILGSEFFVPHRQSVRPGTHQGTICRCERFLLWVVL